MDTFYKSLPHIQRAFVILVIVYLMLPLLIIMPLSVSSGSMLTYPLPGLSLRWYESLLSNPDWLEAAKNSLTIALYATALSTILGTMAALALSEWTSPVKLVFVACIASPLAIPTVVAAVGILFFYSKIGLAQSELGIVVAHTAIALPVVVIPVVSALKSYDRSLTRAAASLGASPLYAFSSVVLPLIAPGVISGALFAFSTSFDELIIAVFLASPDQKTIPRMLFDNIQFKIDPSIAAVATVLVCVSAFLLLVVEALRARRSQ
ncbi:ABC transporter permease [Rhizobium sp. 2MFCol3.1]|uniref:ABC transporter permease n=1 Tax=Rhizobium sp. 2MFCol3.1 TaxID=1246459 RepID=UPI00035E577E|nr:ABC transporter permease [Rhizobium sp. 2MFCol3.1]